MGREEGYGLAMVRDISSKWLTFEVLAAVEEGVFLGVAPEVDHVGVVDEIALLPKVVRRQDLEFGVGVTVHLIQSHLNASILTGEVLWVDGQVTLGVDMFEDYDLAVYDRCLVLK